jgi:hypothetical protein
MVFNVGNVLGRWTQPEPDGSKAMFFVEFAGSVVL